MAVRAPDGFAERLRSAARPAGRHLPVRSCERDGPRRASLPPRHDGHRDQLGDEDRLGRRSGRAAHRSLGPTRGQIRHLPTRPDRLRRRPCPRAHRAMRERRGRARVAAPAAVRLRTATRPVGVHRRRLSRGCRHRRLRRRGCDSRPIFAWDSRDHEPWRARCCPRARRGSARAPGASSNHRTASRKRTSDSSGPRTIGSTGSPAATSPTTRGANISNAAPLHAQGAHLRADRARWLPRRRRRSPRRSAVTGTGTTATAGSATRASRRPALYTLGFDAEANDCFAFVVDMAERDDELQIMYGIDGERELTERVLPHLEGYAGSGQVRVGNGAFDHRQHDVLGAAIDAVSLHTKSQGSPRRAVVADPAATCRVRPRLLASEPDRGIWEVRGEPQHFTSSKAMCWARRTGRAPGDDARRVRARRLLACRRRRDPRRRLQERRRRPRRVHAALRHRRARRVGAAHPPDGVPAARRSSGDRHRPRHRRRAHGPGPRAPLSDEGDRRWPDRRRGFVHHLLVLARVGAGTDRRARRSTPASARSCSRLPARWASTRRSSTRAAAATSATIRKPSLTSRIDQRGNADHQRRTRRGRSDESLRVEHPFNRPPRRRRR